MLTKCNVTELLKTQEALGKTGLMVEWVVWSVLQFLMIRGVTGMTRNNNYVLILF